MKKYDVYGLGNALVDFEYNIKESYVKELKLKKGLMTLVDEYRQHHLFQVLNDLNSKRACGGSAANSMIALSQFGGKSFYSCKVAKDEAGAFYYEDLKRIGVDTNIDINQRDVGITGKCVVMVTPDAERTMETFLGISQEFSTKELDTEAIKDSNFLYIEGYLVASGPSREACIRAKSVADNNNVPVALTFSDPNMIQFFKEGMNSIIGSGIDLLFCNEQEALTFGETDRMDEAVEKIKKIARTFAITLGKKGSLVYNGQKLIKIPPYLVKAIDTNGAGDMYAGAFLYSLSQGSTYSKAGEFASVASSEIVQHFGPRLTIDKARALKEKFSK